MKVLATVAVMGLAGFGLFSARAAEPANAEQAEALSVSAVLTEYVAAIQSRSCARLMSVSANIHDRAECENELHEFIEHRAELTAISKLVRDGRSRSAWLATATLKAEGRQRDIVLRVTNGPRGWRVQA